MANLRAKLKKWSKGKKRGFIIVVALGMFGVISYYGIIVQSATTETVGNIKNSMNYNQAQDLSSSLMEYALFELRDLDAGYNKSFSCCIGEECGTEVGCDEDDIDSSIQARLGNIGREINISYEITGRSEGDENFTGTCPGVVGSGCYVVPYPGTGDAGDRCEMYNVVLPSDAGALVNDKGQVGTIGEISQIDYSCNWNKLKFGSSSTDRVAIPFYYSTGLDQYGEEQIVNPFKDGLATSFVLRMRTPCLPCFYPDPNSTDPRPDDYRECTLGDDPTICTDDDRYELNEQDGNDIVVQWQLTGTCGDEGEEEECGLIQYVEYKKEIPVDDFSGILESFINTRIDNILLSNKIDGNELYGMDTSTYEKIRIFNPLSFIDSKLIKMQKPILTLYLSGKLFTDYYNNNIPYLEYQVLTNYPIGNPKTKIEILVEVEGNSFKKTLYKEEQKDLIDFAVQN